MVTMKIAIRMDDITPGMDWKKFLRFKGLCDRYGIKPLIGVVPSNMDENLNIDKPENAPAQDFWEYVRMLEKEGWCIAQHGVTHVYSNKNPGCFPLNRLSEFAGTGYEKQYESLKRGKEILSDHGIAAGLFMAPAHSFDRDTVRALRELGFVGLTDGFGSFPYERWGMTFYPISHSRGSVLKNRGKAGYTTFVIHTNTMDESDFDMYARIFEEHRDRLASYSDLLRVKPKKRGVFGNVGEYLMALGKFFLVSGKNLKR